MLVEFSVTNFRSIAERQTLSMVATSAKERPENVFETGLAAFPRLVRSAVVYGPNASGKSNLVRALAFMKQFVVGSSKRQQEGDAINTSSFLFSDTYGDETEFELTFVTDGIRYQYGFAVSRIRVTKEWLFSYPVKGRQTWLWREYTGADTYDWDIKIRGEKKTWQNATRDNALFLSTAVQLNCDQLKPVYGWFRNTLRVIEGGVLPLHSIDACEADATRRSRIIRFLAAADLTISDILIERVDFQTEMNRISKNRGGQLELSFVVEDGDRQRLVRPKIPRVSFAHHIDGKCYHLPIEEESQGTGVLFSFAGPWLDILDTGAVLVVDELNNSLHPLLVRHLIEQFHSNETNGKNAQLIMTTHDTTLLDAHVFRRDQVWFVEKTPQQNSCVYPLSDFSPRKDEALGKGYLTGRYGALPFVRQTRG